MTDEESIKSLFATLEDLWVINKLMIRIRLTLAWLGLFYRSERGQQIKNKLRLELKTGKAIPLKFYLAFVQTHFTVYPDQVMSFPPEDYIADFKLDGLDPSCFVPLYHSTSK